jgi:PAS domain S-box-containing protein
MEPRLHTLLLIAEDGGDVRLVQEMLSKAKDARFNLLCTDRVELGIQHLNAGHVDAVLLDAGASEAVPVETISRLQSAASAAPVVVFSDVSDGEWVLAAVRCGADDVLVKGRLHADMLERVLRTAIERKRFREARFQERSHLSKLITKNAEPIVVVGARGHIRFANPAAEALFGRHLDRLVGVPFGFPLTAGETAEVDILSGNGGRTVAEMRVVDFDWAGESVFLASLRDVSDRKRSEERLRRYERIVDSSSDLIVVVDRDLVCREANGAFLSAYPSDPAQVIGRPAEEVFGAAVYAEHVKSGLDHSLAGLEHHQQCWLGMRSGDQRFVHIAFYPYTDTDQSITGAIVNMRDLTQTKGLEAQLHHSQKMEAIGTLAGGVAHDFNNLLMGIQGYASLMMLNTDHEHPFHQDLQGIKDIVRRASDLTKQLLGFAQGGKYDVAPTDMNALARRDLEMFVRTRKEIDCHSQLEAALWTIEADQNQMSQVLVNLFVNAWQAMPDGGRLTLKTENAVVKTATATAHGVAAGRYVKVSVADTGVGMDALTLQRIFDPFFTTKAPGRGTGLGLASAYGIIRNHMGFIEVRSQKGKGSVFSVYLPASLKPVSPARSAARLLAKGCERLLLVDDEDVIRDVGQKQLERLGYQVTLAQNGQEALDRFAEQRAAIDLVILDMIMPGMGGGETFDRLRAIDPRVKVLLCSGYSLEGQAARIMERGCNGFIQKPFSLDSLSNKLRELLD